MVTSTLDLRSDYITRVKAQLQPLYNRREISSDVFVAVCRGAVRALLRTDEGSPGRGGRASDGEISKVVSALLAATLREPSDDARPPPRIPAERREKLAIASTTSAALYPTSRASADAMKKLMDEAYGQSPPAPLRGGEGMGDEVASPAPRNPRQRVAMVVAKAAAANALTVVPQELPEGMRPAIRGDVILVERTVWMAQQQSACQMDEALSRHAVIQDESTSRVMLATQRHSELVICVLATRSSTLASSEAASSEAPPQVTRGSQSATVALNATSQPQAQEREKFHVGSTVTRVDPHAGATIGTPRRTTTSTAGDPPEPSTPPPAAALAGRGALAGGAATPRNSALALLRRLRSDVHSARGGAAPQAASPRPPRTPQRTPRRRGPTRAEVVEHLRGLLQPAYNAGRWDPSACAVVVRKITAEFFARAWKAGSAEDDAEWKDFLSERVGAELGFVDDLDGIR